MAFDRACCSAVIDGFTGNDGEPGGHDLAAGCWSDEQADTDDNAARIAHNVTTERLASGRTSGLDIHPECRMWLRCIGTLALSAAISHPLRSVGRSRDWLCRRASEGGLGFSLVLDVAHEETAVELDGSLGEATRVVEEAG